MIRGVTLALLILMQSLLMAQNDIWELKQALNVAKKSEEKVKILNQLAYLHLDRSPDMTHYYADQALNETRLLEDRFLQEMDMDLHLTDVFAYEAEANLNKGRAYERQGNERQAKRYFKEALKQARKANHGDIVNQAKDHLDVYQEGKSFDEIAINVFETINKIEVWAETAKVDPEILEKTRDVAVSTVQPLAQDAQRNGDYKKAIRYYEILLTYYQADTAKLIETHEILAELYAADNQRKKAKEHQAAADLYAGKKPSSPTPPKPPVAATAPKTLEETVDDIKEVVETEEFSPEVKEAAQVQESSETFRIEAEKHAKQGDYQKSYENLKEYAARQQLVMELKMQRQQDSILISTKLQEIDQLRLEQELQEAEYQQFRTTRYWLFFSLGLILLIAGLLTSLFLNKRKAHRKMKQAFDQLADTHLQLKSAQTQLVSAEKMASLGQLTAGIAHEINNPVNFISGNITPLKHDVKDLLTILEAYEDVIEKAELEENFKKIQQLRQELEIEYVTEEIEELLDGIDEGANRTTEIIKGLRTFARLDDGDWKRFDLHHGLDSTLALLKPRLQGIEILKDYGEIPEIEGYPGKLNQVFMNLLTNAIQAMPQGGLIHLITFPHIDGVEIRIRDTGMGIPKEVRSRIFDPFFTTKEVGEGTGLGLSISHGIIKQHGGSIKIESIDGQGTEVIITLPLKQVSQAITEENVKA